MVVDDLCIARSKQAGGWGGQQVPPVPSGLWEIEIRTAAAASGRSTIGGHTQFGRYKPLAVPPSP